MSKTTASNSHRFLTDLKELYLSTSGAAGAEQATIIKGYLERNITACPEKLVRYVRHILAPARAQAKFTLSDTDKQKWRQYFGLAAYCLGCGSQLNKGRAARSLLRVDTRRYCSSGCSNAHPAVKLAKVASCLATWGVSNPAQAEEVKNRTKDTWMKTYGTDSPFKDPVVAEKRARTWLENYGTTHPWSNEGVSERRKDTLEDRYGVRNPQHSEEIQSRTAVTNKDRYGSSCPLSNKAVRRKADRTRRRKYGGHQMQNAEFREQHLKASFKTKSLTLNGVTYEGLQGSEPQAIAWLLEQHPAWARKLLTSAVEVGTVRYKFRGKIRTYFPDFRLGDVLVEVKSAYTFGSGTDAAAKERRAVLRAKLRAAEKAGFTVRLMVQTRTGWFVARGADFKLKDIRKAIKK